MLNTLAAMFKKISARQMVLTAVAVAALGIPMAVWLSNGGMESQIADEEVERASCAAQPEIAAKIDAAAIGELAALTATATGRSYADAAFIDDTGRPMTLADFAGKALLVNLWATWCVPCREEMPALNALAADYNSDDFAVVTINLDVGDEGILKAQKFLDEEKLGNLPLFVDPSFAFFNQLKADAVTIGLPVTLLLDDEGCELGVLQGPAEWTSADAHNVVNALITAVGE